MLSPETTDDTRLSSGPFTLWTDLDFRAWQWGDLLGTDPSRLRGHHLWIHPPDAEEPDACRPLRSLNDLLALLDKGACGAGLVNLALKESIGAGRPKLEPLFEAGLVVAHEGDRPLIEAFDLPPTSLWFSTRQTRGESDELWRKLRSRLRLEPRNPLSQRLHDAVNFFRAIDLERRARPSEPWATVARAVYEDYNRLGAECFKERFKGVHNDLQVIYESRSAMAEAERAVESGTSDLDRLIEAGFDTLEEIKRLLPPSGLAASRAASRRRAGSDLGAHLKIWHRTLDRVGELEL